MFFASAVNGQITPGLKYSTTCFSPVNEVSVTTWGYPRVCREERETWIERCSSSRDDSLSPMSTRHFWICKPVLGVGFGARSFRQLNI